MVNRISVVRVKAIWNFYDAYEQIDVVAKPDYVTNIIFNDCYYPANGNKKKIEIDVKETVDEVYKLLQYTGMMKI